MQGLIPWGDLIGRLLLGQLFVIEAVSKLGNYGAAQAYMSDYGLPALLLPPAIAVELAGGLLVAFGFLTRLAAFVLAGFCLAAAAIFHADFGIHFQKDLALAGAFLILCARGAGPYALDAWQNKRWGFR